MREEARLKSRSEESKLRFSMIRGGSNSPGSAKGEAAVGVRVNLGLAENALTNSCFLHF